MKLAGHAFSPLGSQDRLTMCRRASRVTLIQGGPQWPAGEAISAVLVFSACLCLSLVIALSSPCTSWQHSPTSRPPLVGCHLSCLSNLQHSWHCHSTSWSLVHVLIAAHFVLQAQA